MVNKNYIIGNIEHNYRVLRPSGELLFLTNKSRFDWYLKKGLSDQIDEFTIKLNFEPNGPGPVHPFYLIERPSVCVVCGSEENLTRHHLIPYCYRTAMPDVYKNHSSHDVLLMCFDCHQIYECEHALKLRHYLADKYQAPLNGKFNYKKYKNYNQAIGYASTLIEHSDKMPLENRQRLHDFIQDYFGVEVTDALLQRVANFKKITKASKHPDFVSHGKLVVDKLEDIHEFFILWRKHFLCTMKPEYMSEHWDIDHNIKLWNDVYKRLEYVAK